MSDPTGPQQERTTSYIVPDRSSQDELQRLETQDKMLTSGMGGVLPELSDPTMLRRVLDVGCGTGGWLIHAARTYPTIEKLVGGDVNSKLLIYAQAKAKSLGLDERVEFHEVDALRTLEFPSASFDLVNQRLGSSWLSTSEWPKVLLGYRRVARSGGIIRITECNQVEANSPAMAKLFDIVLEAFYHSGRYFTLSSDGLTSELPRLMTQQGIQNVQTRSCTLVYRAGTTEGQDFYADMARFFRLLLPFFQKWVHVPSDYEEIYQQALKEMQQPDFVATWTYLTFWGTTPEE